MLIKVTAKHIKEGSPMVPCDCPIAKAITEATEQHARIGLKRMTVGQDRYTLYFRNWIRSKLLPDAANTFAHRFDTGFSVEPFEFELDLTPPEIEEGMQ